MIARINDSTLALTMKPILALALFLMLPLAAAEFRSDWQGTRPWVGPEYWAGPLYDWQTVDGAVVAVAAKDRLLHLLSHRPLEPQKGFQMRVSVELLASDKVSNPAAVWAGMAVGVKGMMEDPRHVAVWPKQRIAAVVRADGRLALGPNAVSDEELTGEGLVDLELTAQDGGLRLTGTRNGKSATVRIPVKADDLAGNLCLAASSPRQPTDKRGVIRARFKDWHVSGEGIGITGVEPFGPILWTQYTRQGNTVKLSAQMAPTGDSDAKEVKLDLKQDNEWREAGAATIDPLARTAIFRTEVPAGAVQYRVRYPWNGRDAQWSGTFAEDPARSGRQLKIGVFSCDNGYAFPLPTMVRNVAIQNPDLLFFAGDQIYENYGGYGLVRTPVDKAMLDYLRKFYQFGWTWRISSKTSRASYCPTTTMCSKATCGATVAAPRNPRKPAATRCRSSGSRRSSAPRPATSRTRSIPHRSRVASACISRK
jgi:alkaline phosphatase D